MSNRDPDARYENLAQLLDFDFLQKAKFLIHTAMPGIVPSLRRNDQARACATCLADDVHR